VIACDILKKPGLFVISDVTLSGGRSYTEMVREVLLGGARIILLRDKTTPFDDLMKVGKQLKNLTAEFQALLIVNDNPYLAREINADGVHLGQTDMHADIAREIIGNEKIIGLTTNNFFHIQRAILSEEADYLAIGPVYPTTSKISDFPPVGLKVLEWAARGCPLPFFAFGGITQENLDQVIETGTRLIAMISPMMESSDIATTTRELTERIQGGCGSR
jgi:thiamine-phosphate pyrophosphorylase